MSIHIRPLTPSRWKDLETLFGKNGACGGCWCMYWRVPREEFSKGKGEQNKRAFRRRVQRGGRPPGLIAYVDGAPAGWVAVEPKAAYPSLLRSRRIVQVDQRPCWSVSCLFVARPHRGAGVARALVAAAVAHARRNGADLIEAYPVEVGEDVPDTDVWTGVTTMFRDAGFQEVASGNGAYRVMRRES